MHDLLGYIPDEEEWEVVKVTVIIIIHVYAWICICVKLLSVFEVFKNGYESVNWNNNKVCKRMGPLRVQSTEMCRYIGRKYVQKNGT